MDGDNVKIYLGEQYAGAFFNCRMTVEEMDESASTITLRRSDNRTAYTLNLADFRSDIERGWIDRMQLVAA